MTSGIRLTSFLALAVAAAFVIFASAKDSAAISTFTPGGVICFEKFDAFDYHPNLAIQQEHECDGDASPNATSDTRVKFCVGWNDDCTVLDPAVTDSNFGGATGFIPLAAVLKAGKDYPVGALVGRLSADPVLGVLGNPCIQTLSVGFTLMNGSVDMSEGNRIQTKGIGQPDVMEPLARDTNTNGIPDGADRYPSFLVSRFDIDHDFGPDAIPNTSVTPTSDDVNGPIAPHQPLSRLFGATKIFGMWVTLNLMVFQPGIQVLGPERTPITLNESLGYPTAIVLQDPTVPLAPGAVSDFCAPLNTRFVSFGLSRDNPCTGLDTNATRGNCPSEFNTALENLGYPLVPCEVNNNIDEDQDGKTNDGCPTTGGLQNVPAAPETGTQCDDAVNSDPENGDSDVNDGCPAVGESEAVYTGTGCAGQNEGGCEVRKNSAQEGTVAVPIGTRSLRDADGDGIENALDVCALKSNGSWNARAVDAVNDPDNDGLPTDCDPSPNDSAPKGLPPGSPPNSPSGCEKGIVGPDYDQDCYANRQDNCPLTNQLKRPNEPASYNVPAQANDNVPQLFDKDEDGIGDLCDIKDCAVVEVTPGDGGRRDAAYSAADCALFGVSAKGTDPKGENSQDGDFAVDCVTFAITVKAGGDPRGPAPSHNTDPKCLEGLLAAPEGPAVDPRNPTTTNTTQTQCVGANCATVSGIGSLSPVGASVPAWAAILAGFGGVGMIGGLGLIGARFARRRE